MVRQPPSYPHLERLVTAVFDPTGVTIDRIAGATVLDGGTDACAGGHRPRSTSRWQQHQPSFQLADLRGTFSRAGARCWADLYATVRLDLVAEVDPGGIESAVTSSIGNITSLADFQSRFRFLDLDDFLARMRISTVEELRESAEYVLTEVRLRQLPPFDPTDPANTRSVTLDVAVAVLDERDLAAAPAGGPAAAGGRRAADPGRADPVLGPARHPFALAVVLPPAVAGIRTTTPSTRCSAPPASCRDWSPTHHDGDAGRDRLTSRHAPREGIRP